MRSNLRSARPLCACLLSATIVAGCVLADSDDDKGIERGAAAVTSPSSFTVKINFQLAGAPIPAGYLADTGAVFGPRNGLSYGWNRNHGDVTRDRNINPDQRLDTLSHFHAGGFWQIELPNGTYSVTASVGDAQFASTHTLNVEGISYWNARALAANQFLNMTRSVTVADGRLNVDQGSAGEMSTRINYLEIASVGSSPDGGADAPGTDASTDAGGASVWTGTWAAAPQSCGATSGQTVRSIVRTSIGGDAARVRLSNAFGNGPLRISNVHLAQRTTGSSIDPATDRALTFAGQSEVTVAAGMFALSDGANFVVNPNSDVAISFFVVASSGGTCQPNAFQTNFTAGGNVAASPTLNGAQNTNSYLYALGLDVQNPAAEGAVVALGASITTGFSAGSNNNRRWPNLLSVRLLNASRVVGVLNEGISGDGTTGAVNRFGRDVLSQTNVKWVIFSDNPINDLGGSTAEADINLIKMMISRAHARGVKFLCSTLTPFTPVEPKRTTVINFIKSADSGCDGIIDQDRATHNPDAPTMWAGQFNSGDNLHPNAAGMQAIADIVDLAIFR
jgi:lysophospholipase L1-like esterase